MAYKVTDTVSLHGDEYYTLPKTAEQILAECIDIPHLKVWMPFNDRNSAWGGYMLKKGYDPLYTDGDFFQTEPPAGTQAIISNPPFSKKKDVLDRTTELGLPFVYILPYLWMNDGLPFEYGNQILMFRKRMHFTDPTGTLNKPRCNCFVLSNGLLKQEFKVIWE